MLGSPEGHNPGDDQHEQENPQHGADGFERIARHRDRAGKTKHRAVAAAKRIIHGADARKSAVANVLPLAFFKSGLHHGIIARIAAEIRNVTVVQHGAVSADPGNAVDVFQAFEIRLSACFDPACGIDGLPPQRSAGFLHGLGILKQKKQHRADEKHQGAELKSVNKDLSSHGFSSFSR